MNLGVLQACVRAWRTHPLVVATTFVCPQCGSTTWQAMLAVGAFKGVGCWEACTEADGALMGWRAQYASPVVETTVVGPQYGTTTLPAMLASVAVARGVVGRYRIRRYIGLQGSWLGFLNHAPSGNTTAHVNEVTGNQAWVSGCRCGDQRRHRHGQRMRYIT
jgi:hypothetical protein